VCCCSVRSAGKYNNPWSRCG